MGKPRREGSLLYGAGNRSGQPGFPAVGGTPKRFRLAGSISIGVFPFDGRKHGNGRAQIFLQPIALVGIRRKPAIVLSHARIA